MADQSLYPLAVGNSWTYRMNDGRTYTNAITAEKDGVFSMSDSMTQQVAGITRRGDEYLVHRAEYGQWVPMLNEQLKPGDTWQFAYRANGVDTNLVHVVKNTDQQFEVEGKNYRGVALIEAESKMSMNGRAIPMQFFTQYYYARGVGLILTTTSSGDAMPLVAFELK